jgi:hypothetical protein
VVGVDADQGLQREGFGQRTVQGQRFVAYGIARGRQRRPVSADFQQRQFLAIQYQIATRVFVGGVRIAPTGEACAHLGMAIVDGDVELDRVDQPGRRGVVLEVDGVGSFGAHVVMCALGWGWADGAGAEAAVFARWGLRSTSVSFRKKPSGR